MYPEYARDTVTGWVVGHRESDFALDLDHARALVAEQRPTSCSCRRRTTRPAPPCRREAVATLCEAAATGVVVVDEAYGEFRRAGTPSALELLPTAPQPGRDPHHEQGVRARRRPARLPRRRPRDLRRDPRRAAAVPPVGGHPGGRARRRCGTRRSCSARSTSCGPSATTRSPGCASRACEVADSDANFALFGTLRRPSRGVAGRCSTAAC